jgi:ribosomal protein S18 acetylase RimI-like enzyme
MDSETAHIRPYLPEDLDDLYHIALATGDSGADASEMYLDPMLVGHLYAAPYAVLSPETAFVVEDAEGVGGYIVGALDTRAFEAQAEAEWWPTLRPLYADPSVAQRADWSPDELLSYLIHHPFPAPRRVVKDFPSHLHINLLPRLQGQDMGRRLIDRWQQTIREMGSPGVHLGVSRANLRGVRFYRAYGFQELVLDGAPAGSGHWFTLPLT